VLIRLLTTLTCIHQILPRGAALPEFDVHAPLLSLPFIFGTTLDCVPAQVPYIAAPASSNIKIRTSRAETIKVGIVWAGSRTHDNDRNRSCDIALFKNVMNFPNLLIQLAQACGKQEKVFKPVNDWILKSNK